MMVDIQADRDEAILWARRILETDFVVLDTETTGLDWDDEAVSVGLVAKDGTVLLDTLLFHEKASGFQAEMVHKITWEMTRTAPHFRDVWPQLVALTERKILLGYNASFDTRIISQMMRRYEIDGLPIFRADAGDVMSWFAQFYGQYSDYHGSYTWKKLTLAAAFLGVATDGAHGAAADALMTLRVIEQMAAVKTKDEQDVSE